MLFFDRNCANEHYKNKDQKSLTDNLNPRKDAVRPQSKTADRREREVHRGPSTSQHLGPHSKPLTSSTRSLD